MRTLSAPRFVYTKRAVSFGEMPKGPNQFTLSSGVFDASRLLCAAASEGCSSMAAAHAAATTKPGARNFHDRVMCLLLSAGEGQLRTLRPGAPQTSCIGM